MKLRALAMLAASLPIIGAAPHHEDTRGVLLHLEAEFEYVSGQLGLLTKEARSLVPVRVGSATKGATPAELIELEVLLEQEAWLLSHFDVDTRQHSRASEGRSRSGAQECKRRKRKGRRSRYDVYSLEGPCYRHVPEASRRHNVHMALLAAFIRVESAGRPNAVSSAGAVGCGQMMPATARGLGLSREERYHPRKNVLASARYIRRIELKILKRWPTATLATVIGSYFEGPRSALRTGRLRYAKSERYAAVVLRYYHRILERWRGHNGPPSVR